MAAISDRPAPRFIPISVLPEQEQIEVADLIHQLYLARLSSNLFTIDIFTTDISPTDRSPIVCVADSFYHSLSYPLIDAAVSKTQLFKTYLALRSEKWRECIDGEHHDKGMFVYDLGLHGGPIEPGFIGSMENAFQFILPYLNRKIDSQWYLKLHEETCAHFNGDPSVFLIGQEKVGVFRTSEDRLFWILSEKYALTPEARREFKKLDRALKREFGESYGLGELIQDPDQVSTRLNYKAMSREQVTVIFNKFLKDFYHGVERAKTQDQKLWAIARLHQRLEWLHPVCDGTGRTNGVLLNKFLTEYGFHPVTLRYPYVSSSYGLVRWKHYLEQGLIKWENAFWQKNSVNSRSIGN